MEEAAGSWWLGVSADGWVAIGTLILAIATLVLVVVGAVQLVLFRRETTRDRTLRACDAYDSDPVLHECHGKLHDARISGEMEKNARQFRREIITVLNHLDGLAIGIRRRLYDEDLARDYLEHVVKHHTRQYLSVASPECGLHVENFAVLIALSERWEMNLPRLPRKRRPWMEDAKMPGPKS